MNKLIEIGSTFLIPLSIPFMLEGTDVGHKIAVILLFISSLLYHYTNKKTDKLFLNNNIYIHDENYNILKLLDKICICYIYLYNSRLCENKSPFTIYYICFFMASNETRLKFLLFTCLFSIIPYLTIIPIYQSILFVLSISLKGFIYVYIEDFTIPIKYLWHFISSLTMFTTCYINIAYSLPKTELYNQTNMIVKIVYFALVINFIIYKNTLNNLNNIKEINKK